jgi:hypothetical protein
LIEDDKSTYSPAGISLGDGDMALKLWVKHENIVLPVKIFYLF